MHLSTKNERNESVKSKKGKTIPESPVSFSNAMQISSLLSL